VIGFAGIQTLISNGAGNTLEAGPVPTELSYAVANITVDLAAGVAEANGATTGDTLLGCFPVALVAGTGDTVLADSGNDTLTAAGSGDTVIGGTGNDTLIVAGGASNVLEAGSGADTLLSDGTNDTLIAGSGIDTLASSDTGDTLVGNAGGSTLISTGTQSVASYAADHVAVDLAAGTATINGATTGDTLVGITAALVYGSSDTVLAGSGTNTLLASGASDTLVAGSGTDTLAATGGGASYQFATGDGQATIVNGAPGSTSASNELDFGGGIADNDLWLLQRGNDLQIDVMGTSSAITIANWFASAGNQLQEITAGGLKLDSQVSQLVQAMATYAANNPGFDPTAVTQAPNDPNLQNAIAAAWHH
jgi:Ca2+-binding RTX toxin-like protein